MGYESLENDSLIILKLALESYIKRSAHGSVQNNKDVTYELDRVNSELNSR